MAALFLGAEITSAAPPKAGAKPPLGLVRLPAPPPKASDRLARKAVATIGEWEVREARHSATASTENESGSVFGLICGDKCLFYFDLQIACDEGVAYRATIDGPNGQNVINLRCMHFGTSLPLLSVEADASTMFDLLRHADGLIAVSVSLGAKSPRVASFSLAGGAEAARQAIDRARMLGPPR